MSRLLTIFAALAALTTPVLAQQNPNQRISATLPFDANVTTNVWADLSGGYRTFGDSAVTADASDLFLTANFAFELLANLEIGGQAELVSRDFDNDALGSDSGPSDLFAWGKYAFFRRGDLIVSAGAFVSVPTGDDDAGLGTGNVEPGAFIAGGTRAANGMLLQAHLGLRANGDFEGPTPGDRDGKTSVLLGLGGLVEPNPGFEAFASIALETERVEDGESWAQISGGARWRLADAWRVQGQAGFGLADAAPDFFVSLGVVWAP